MAVTLNRRASTAPVQSPAPAGPPPGFVIPETVGYFVIFGVMGLIMLVPIAYVVCQCDVCRATFCTPTDAAREKSESRKDKARHNKGAEIYGSAV